ncbi:MAG: hypothetical protein U0573_10760 [Phycisphaerales bacterium]|nr:hypothetical protein [Planctomycetota bacterium]
MNSRLFKKAAFALPIIALTSFSLAAPASTTTPSHQGTKQSDTSTNKKHKKHKSKHKKHHTQQAPK